MYSFRYCIHTYAKIYFIKCEIEFIANCIWSSCFYYIAIELK